jgi:alcohol dehydrogenase (cytochrome c)
MREAGTKGMTYFLAAGVLLPACLLSGQAPYHRILHAGSDPGNWLTYSGAYDGHRYSPLRQISTANVARLKPAWIYQISDPNKFETSPLVVDGLMFLTEPPGYVTALDARTGRPLWRYQRPIPEDVHVCCGQVNRGAAILDDALFFGTLDAHVVSLDSKTGYVIWDVPAADYKAGYTITAAPLAVKDKVIIGIAGGEFGVRGFIDAYEAKTGRRAWRFWTVPGPGVPGNETWAGESWKTGSAATWLTGSYDPDLNLVYWGVGNPGPDYNGESRKGDNLYSASLVALDADTGKLKWHFQFTPHDTHDWDANQIPVLIDGMFRGSPRKLVVTANRNGFYYVLDRRTGEFLAGKEFAKQNWAKGLDARGRPIVLPGKSPSLQGTPVYPSLHGGTNWFSPSYDPDTNLFYVAVREEGTIFFLGEAQYRMGALYTGGSFRGIPGVQPTGYIRALEAETGRLRWEFPLQSPPWAGVLSTAGGLVFGATNEGYVFALDAVTGKPLWRFQTGGAAYANPITYTNEGRQFVAIAAGHALMTFAVE